MRIKTKFDKKGNVRAKFFVDEQGEKTGWYRSFYANGQVHTESSYAGNKLHGETWIYSPNGCLKKVEKYNKGILQRRLYVFCKMGEKSRN